MNIVYELFCIAYVYPCTVNIVKQFVAIHEIKKRKFKKKKRKKDIYIYIYIYIKYKIITQNS